VWWDEMPIMQPLHQESSTCPPKFPSFPGTQWDHSWLSSNPPLFQPRFWKQRLGSPKLGWGRHSRMARSIGKHFQSPDGVECPAPHQVSTYLTEERVHDVGWVLSVAYITLHITLAKTSQGKLVVPMMTTCFINLGHILLVEYKFWS